MFLDIFSGGKRRQASHSQIQKIKEGGKKADIIRSIEKKYHSQSEIPQAEEELQAALEDIPSNSLPEVKKPTQETKSNWFTRVKLFFFSK